MAKKTRDGLFQRGSIWWIRTDPITGRQLTTRCRDREAARRFRAERERQAASPHTAAASRETLGSATDRVTDGRRAVGKDTDFHETKLGHWLRIFGEDYPLARIDADAVDTFVGRRRGEGASDHTITKEVGCMLRALRLSKRLGLYTGDLSVLRPPDLSARYVPRTRALTPPELGKLLAALPPHRAAFVALCVGLGLRRSEALSLRPGDVNLRRGLVTVRGTKTELSRRTVPIYRPFRALVERASRLLPLAPWPAGADCRDLAVACRRAGIERCSPNDLRRTFATLLRSGGAEADAVRRSMGHSPSSRLLESVYDQPTDLAARVGELVTITQQLDAALDGTGWNSAGFAIEHQAHGAYAVGRPDGFSREKLAVGTAGERWGPVANVTTTQHSPAAHALAYAAARAFGGMG